MNLRSLHSASSQWVTLIVVSIVITGTIAASLEAQTTESQNESSEVVSTIGATPPAGATVLFDGSNFDAWMPFSFGAINRNNDQKEVQWKLVDGDAMEITPEFEGKRRQQWLCTKEKFGDYRLHLEFRLPEKGGSNAGLFFGPLYELQILDSAGKEKLKLSDCGSLYQMKLPDENAALPRGQWQTYDLQYQHAKISANGTMTETGAARMTARLNGVLIHDDIRLSLRRNKYAAYPEETTSKIIFQDHGAAVQFRNIWIEEVKKKSNPVKQLIEELGPRKKESEELTLPKRK